MLATKYVGDNYVMLVTVLAVLVTNIIYLLNKRRDQQPKDVNTIEIQGPLMWTVAKSFHNIEPWRKYVAEYSTRLDQTTR